MATPNANQAPQGAGTSPRSPLVAMGGLWGAKSRRGGRRVSFFALGFQLGVPWIFRAASESFQANRPQGDIALPAVGFVSQNTFLLEFTNETVIERKQLTAASV